jgi:Tol biopolymer transport system component
MATMPIGGGATRTILRDARLAGSPAWSPDGSKLVFLSSRAGANAHVWVMDADGGNLHRLTTWAEPDNGAVFTDDSTVVLRSNHDARFGDLWRVAASGGEPNRLTHTGTVIRLCGQPFRPSEVIVGVLADAPVNITSARLRSGGVLQPIWDRTTAVCGEVSPTTDSVALTVGAGADQQTMLVPLNGGAGRAILEKNQLFFGWSPNGGQLLFSYTQNAPYDLGVYSMADGSERRVTNTPESEEWTEWSPDGSTLVFIRVVPVSRITTVDVTRLLSRGK